MTTFGESYKEMSHRGSEGRFLDIRNPNERFELYLSQIDFLDQNTSRRLLGLIQPNYGHLNPYAYVIGFTAVASDPLTRKLVITKESLELAYKLLSRRNHYDEELSKLIDKSDIVRYARMYIRLQTSAINKGGGKQIDDDDDDDEVNPGYEDEDNYDEDNVDFEGDNFDFDGDFDED
jgi:hypothetical protein